VDDRNEKVNFKIREAQLQKIPYMLVVGDREESSGNVAVRHRKRGDLGVQSFEDFVATITPLIAARDVTD
jgi:threonyl-tRNA synthetase